MVISVKSFYVKGTTVCIVCGSSAGCTMCEFQENCDISNVSQFCICKRCSEEKNAFVSYQKSTNKKFSILNSWSWNETPIFELV